MDEFRCKPIIKYWIKILVYNFVDSSVNIFDLVLVAGNFGQSAVTAAPSMGAKIELSTEQKHHIASAIDHLESNSNRSSEEEIALNILIAILPP